MSDDVPGAVVMAFVEGFVEAAEGADAIGGAEVFSLDVFGELGLEGFLVGEGADDTGDGGEASDFCGKEAALTDDDLVGGGGGIGSGEWADEEGLSDAVLGDIGCEDLDAIGSDEGAGSAGIELELVEWKLEDGD